MVTNLAAWALRDQKYRSEAQFRGCSVNIFLINNKYSNFCQPILTSGSTLKGPLSRYWGFFFFFQSTPLFSEKALVVSPPLSLRHPIMYQICWESSILSILRRETENFIFGSRLSMQWMLMVIILLLSTLRVVHLLVWALCAFCYHSFSSCQSKPKCSVLPLGSQATHPRAPEHTVLFCPEPKHYVDTGP